MQLAQRFSLPIALLLDLRTRIENRCFCWPTVERVEIKLELAVQVPEGKGNYPTVRRTNKVLTWADSIENWRESNTNWFESVTGKHAMLLTVCLATEAAASVASRSEMMPMHVGSERFLPNKPNYNN